MILFYGGKEEEDILKERPEEWLGHEERRKKLEVLCNEVSSSFKNRGKKQINICWDCDGQEYHGPEERIRNEIS